MVNDELYETINCPLCEGDKFKVIYPANYPTSLSKEDLLKIYCSSSDEKLLDQLVQCVDCSLVYLNPRTTPAVLIKSYSQAVDPTFVKQDLQRIRCFDKELRQIIRQCGITPDKNKKILDVGCAGGAFLKAANDIGFDVIGVEPSHWMCEYGKKVYGVNICQGQLIDQKFEPSSFDVVSFWDVIEHLSRPGEVLEHAHGLLKNDGTLIINYPDYGSCFARILGSKWPFLLSVHLIYYDRNTIKRQLEKCGFEVMEIKPYWQVLELGYILRRASSYFGVFKIFENVINALSLKSLSIKYNMGQTRVIARKR